MKSISKLVMATLFTSGSIFMGQFAIAHHSTVGQISEEVTQITGTIKEFQFQNPHSWIQVNVTDVSGEVVEWSVEWGNPNNLLRQGYTPSTFPEGAEVTMKLRQHYTGAPLGEFNAARFADGSTVGRWDD
jgi:hypothetical protein